MLCITAAEATARATEERIRASTEPFHELRLDLSDEIEAHLRLIRGLARSHKILATCRPTRQKGGYGGPERKRISILERALASGAWAVDMERDCRGADVAKLASVFGADRILISDHIWEPIRRDSVGMLRRLAAAMAAMPAKWIKIAATVEDVADLAVFVDLADQVPKGRAVLVPMGRAGRPGRIRYRRMGSAWTYVAAEATKATAPGQVDLAQAKTLRMNESSWLLALVGGPSVYDSPGPMVYNAWLAEQGLPFQYLAAQTDRFADAIALLERLGLVGASVTMPHKAAALELAEDVHPQALAVGAANTLCHRSIFAAGSRRAAGPDPNGPKGWQALNTDVYGIRQALKAAGSLEGRRALLLGAGGAAAAALFALRRLGAEVTLAVRDPDRARALAQRFHSKVVAWSDRGDVAFEVLVNATPVGRDGLSLPMDPDLLEGKVVFDMLLRPHPSPLVHAAQKAGAGLVRSGLHMWVAQGRAQMRRWTGRAPDEAWMTERTGEILRNPS